MRIKIKQIALVLFLFSAIFIIINIKYQDEIASVIPDLDYAKFFFYLGIISFIIYLIISKLKKTLTFLLTITIISFCFSMFFNLRLAKNNYDRIKCNKGMSEYYKYFEYESCEKIKKRFEEDLINGETKYFQDKYNSDLEFEERLRDEHDIELIGISCTQFTSMECYNNLVKEYIKKR
jgi:hypothetical protein